MLKPFPLKRGIIYSSLVISESAFLSLAYAHLPKDVSPNSLLTGLPNLAPTAPSLIHGPQTWCAFYDWVKEIFTVQRTSQPKPPPMWVLPDGVCWAPEEHSPPVNPVPSKKPDEMSLTCVLFLLVTHMPPVAFGSTGHPVATPPPPSLDPSTLTQVSKCSSRNDLSLNLNEWLKSVVPSPAVTQNSDNAQELQRWSQEENHIDNSFDPNEAIESGSYSQDEFDLSLSSGFALVATSKEKCSLIIVKKKIYLTDEEKNKFEYQNYYDNNQSQEVPTEGQKAYYLSYSPDLGKTLLLPVTDLFPGGENGVYITAAFAKLLEKKDLIRPPYSSPFLEEAKLRSAPVSSTTREPKAQVIPTFKTVSGPEVVAIITSDVHGDKTSQLYDLPQVMPSSGTPLAIQTGLIGKVLKVENEQASSTERIEAQDWIEVTGRVSQWKKMPTEVWVNASDLECSPWKLCKPKEGFEPTLFTVLNSAKKSTENKLPKNSVIWVGKTWGKGASVLFQVKYMGSVEAAQGFVPLELTSAFNPKAGTNRKLPQDQAVSAAYSSTAVSSTLDRRSALREEKVVPLKPSPQSGQGSPSQRVGNGPEALSSFEAQALSQGQENIVNKAPLLIIGDSSLMYAKDRLMPLLEAQGFSKDDIYIFSACGSRGTHWLDAADLNDPSFCGLNASLPPDKGGLGFASLNSLVKKIKPKLVVMSLGANDYKTKNPEIIYAYKALYSVTNKAKIPLIHIGPWGIEKEERKTELPRLYKIFENLVSGTTSQHMGSSPQTQAQKPAYSGVTLVDMRNVWASKTIGESEDDVHLKPYGSQESAFLTGIVDAIVNLPIDEDRNSSK